MGSASPLRFGRWTSSGRPFSADRSGAETGYDRWATKHNLQQMAKTVLYYEEQGFSSVEELKEAFEAASADMRESFAALKKTEGLVSEKKEFQRHLLNYISTKPARDGLKAQKSEKARKAWREQHESDFILADTAVRYFKSHGVAKLPSSKVLQKEIEQLTVKKNEQYNDYREKRDRFRELQTARENIRQMSKPEPKHRKEQDYER